MKPRTILATFEYKSYYKLAVVNNQSVRLQPTTQLPLLEVKIDFASGKLTLQADWQFILQCNKHIERRRLQAYKNRVLIQMELFDSSAIDLNDSSSNELMLPLEGTIMDELILNDCTGMLVFKNKSHNKKHSNLWRLAIYVYDLSNDLGEIKIDLPLAMAEDFQMN